MVRLLIILLFGLACESTGVILLKKGMTHIGDINGYNVAEMLRVFKAGAASPQILLGVFFEAVFFGCLLLLGKHGRQESQGKALQKKNENESESGLSFLLRLPVRFS